jgi:hypothetical protein
MVLILVKCSKNVNRQILFWVLLIFIFSSACESWLAKTYAFKMKNNSGRAIRFCFAYSPSESRYPDTSLPINSAILLPLAAQASAVRRSSAPWQTLIANTPADTLSIYVIAQDTLAKYPWDTIRARYNILQRYDISAQDYENRNEVLEYPYDSTLGKLKVFRK